MVEELMVLVYLNLFAAVIAALVWVRSKWDARRET
jgi:hypothetical protein